MHSYFGHDDWSALRAGPQAHRRRYSHPAQHSDRLRAGRDHGRSRPNSAACSLSSSSAAARPALKWPAPSRKSRGRHWPPISAGSIRASARIVLIEAGPRLLPAFPPEQSDYVRGTLMHAGVTVMTDTMVTKCDARGVDLNSGRLDAGTIIWAAGVMASPAGAVARRRSRSRRTGEGQARFVGAGPSGDFRHRRHRGGDRSQRPAGSRHRAGGQADGAICRRS